MSVIRRIQIGENHKSAEVLNRPVDDLLTLSGLTPGATFTGFAKVGDVTPVVASASARDAAYPTPTTDQRAFNKQTGNLERYNGTAWVVDIFGAAPLLVPSASPASTSYGDSFSANQGASAAVHGFVNIIAAALGATNTSLASGGTGVLYAVNKLIITEAIPRTAGYVTFMAGLNDVRRGGSAAKTIAKLATCTRAALATLFAKTAIAANDAGVTLGGSWANFSFQGMSQHLSGTAQQGALGATATITTTGESLIVGYLTSDNATFTFGPATVSVDGVVVATIDPGNATDGITDGTFTNTVGYGALVLRNLGSGTHTVVITPTTATVFTLDWIGTLNAPQACPPVVVGTIPRLNATGYAASPNAANDTVVEAGSQTIIGVVNEFAGFPVRVAYPNTDYSLSTGVNADNIHPNDIGHAQIAATFLRVIGSGGAVPIDVATAATAGTAHVGKNSVASAASATAFGDTARASATNTTAVGTNANASAASSTVVGSSSSAAALRGVALGTSAAANSSVGTDGTAVGQAAVANHNGAVAVGSTASVSGGQYGVAAGYGASVTASDGVAIGKQAAVTHAESTAIGAGAASTAANQVMLGLATQTVQSLGNVNLGGSGKTLGFLGATPVVRPTLAAAATDLATVITLANSIRTALINLGLGV